MSLNMATIINDDRSSSATSSMQVPAFTGGNYLAWGQLIDAFLMRQGVEDVHKAKMEHATWVALKAKVDAWAKAETDDAVAWALGSIGGASASAAAGAVTESDTKKKLVKKMVERSQRAYGYLVQALPEELRALVRADVPEGFAFGLWDLLERKYKNTEVENVAELWSKWNDLRMGDDSETFDAYKARVEETHSLLVHAKNKPPASQYMHALLYKLRAEFQPGVLALQAAGKLKDHERIDWAECVQFMRNFERSLRRMEAEPEAELAKTFAARTRPGASASSFTKNKFDGVRCHKCHKLGHIQRNCPLNEEVQKSNNKQPDRCAVCDMRNHTTEEHDDKRMPPWARKRAEDKQNEEDDSKGKAFSAVSKTKSVSHRGDSSESAFAFGVVSKFEVKATQRPMRVDVAPAKRVKSYAEVVKGTCVDDPIHIDTGASRHVTGNRPLISNLAPVQEAVDVQTADGTTVRARRKGEITVKVRGASKSKEVELNVKNVLYDEKFSATLLSWGALRDQGWTLHSRKGEDYVVSPTGVKISLAAHGRLLTLINSRSAERACVVREPKLSTVDEFLRLHCRMAHMGWSSMLNVLKQDKTEGVGKLCANANTLEAAKKGVMECEVCIRAKGTRAPLGQRGLERGQAPGEVLHMDTFAVKYTMPGTGDLSVEYGVVVVDAYSEAKWFRFAAKKSLIGELIIDLVKLIKTQFGRQVKRIHCDGGSEYIRTSVKDFCRGQGIELLWTPAGTPDMNSIAERAVRSTKEPARAMLLQSGLPARYWREATDHHVEIWNRTHVAQATGVTPHEVLTGRKPSLQRLHTFGCDAWFHIPKSERLTFDCKMEPATYIGHSHQQNCSKVYCLRTKKVVMTRDVRCIDDKFAHARIMSQDGVVPDAQKRVAVWPDWDGEQLQSRDPVLPPSEPARLQGGREPTGQPQPQPPIPQAVLPQAVQHDAADDEADVPDEEAPMPAPFHVDDSDSGSAPADQSDESADAQSAESEPSASAPVSAGQPGPLYSQGNIDFYEAESVMDMRMVNGKRQYLVKFVGYEEPEWHPESSVRQEFIEDWQQRHKVVGVRFKGLLRRDGSQTGTSRKFQASMTPAASVESANALILQRSNDIENRDSESEPEDQQA